MVTNSGGPSILAADKAEAVGLIVAEPDTAVKAKLAAFLPAHAALKNPIDLTVEGTEKGYRETLTALFERNQVSSSNLVSEGALFDAAVAINIAPPYLESLSIARGIVDAARTTGKPILTSFLPKPSRPALAYLHENGILNFPTPERAVTALANMARLPKCGPDANPYDAYAPRLGGMSERPAPGAHPRTGRDDVAGR